MAGSEGPPSATGMNTPGRALRRVTGRGVVDGNRQGLDKLVHSAVGAPRPGGSLGAVPGVDRNPHSRGLDRTGKSVRERRLASGIRAVDGYENPVPGLPVDELDHPVDDVHTGMLPGQHRQQHQ